MHTQIEGMTLTHADGRAVDGHNHRSIRLGTRELGSYHIA
jgi:hypothetical protein